MTLVPRLVDSPAAVAGPQLEIVYDPALVTLSVALAAITAFVTLRVAGHLRTTSNAARRRRLTLVGGLSLGGGIWSMHFTGMLAASLPVEVTYAHALTVTSLLLPILSSGFGLHLIRKPVISTARLLAAGTSTGLGIALMHYVGMAAMRAPVEMAYVRDGFWLSIAVAVIASCAGFWFAKRFSDERVAEPSIPVAAGTSLILAFAISSMHYIGMGATVLADRPGLSVDTSFALDPQLMTGGIAIVLLIVLSAAQLMIWLEENASGRIRLAAPPLLMAAIATIAGGMAMTVLYDTAFRQERAELEQMLRAQRALIEAVARFDREHSHDALDGGAAAATLSQIRDAHGAFGGFGTSGEYYLARRDTAVDYVVPLRFPTADDASGDRPMSLALDGLTGTTVAPDYRGRRVLAAYTSIPALGLGLVVKIDMAEIRAPFVTAGGFVLGVVVFLIIVGFVAARRISLPLQAELDEKTRLDIELEFASAVQSSLLPPDAPKRGRFTCAASMEPARYVSGDFYDFVEIDDNTTAVVIGDVSGKGVSAALLMARIVSEMRHVLSRERIPAVALGRLNIAISEHISHGMFATVCCMLIDTESRYVDIANAGHLPLLLRKQSGEVVEAGPATGPPVGILESVEFQTERLVMEPGEVLLAYTDGAVELRDRQGELFGARRLRDCVAVANHDARDLLHGVRNALDQFVGDTPRADDLTLVALGFMAPPG